MPESVGDLLAASVMSIYQNLVLTSVNVSSQAGTLANATHGARASVADMEPAQHHRLLRRPCPSFRHRILPVAAVKHLIKGHCATSPWTYILSVRWTRRLVQDGNAV